MPNSPSIRYTYVTTWYTFLIKLYYNMELLRQIKPMCAIVYSMSTG